MKIITAIIITFAFCNSQSKAQNGFVDTVLNKQASIGAVYINTYTNTAFDSAIIAARLKQIQCIPNACNVVLPIRILEFNGIKKQAGNDLFWKTIGAENVQNFELERSADAVSFIKIATIPAINTPNSKQYQFMDYTYWLSKNYYRLKSNDADGKFMYSKIIMLDNSTSAVNIFPNPAKNIVTIQFFSTKKTSAHFVIYDVASKIIYETNRQIFAGNNNNTFNVQKWPSGMYLLKMYTNENTAIPIFKIIKE
jgi:hypothetical protein